jgi:hypothetical protein
MEERGRIIGMLAGGCTVPEVAKAYRRSDRCLRVWEQSTTKPAQQQTRLGPEDLQYYCFIGRKSYTGKHVLIQRLNTQSLQNMEPLSDQMAHL